MNKQIFLKWLKINSNIWFIPFSCSFSCPANDWENLHLLRLDSSCNRSTFLYRKCNFCINSWNGNIWSKTRDKTVVRVLEKAVDGLEEAMVIS